MKTRPDSTLAQGVSVRVPELVAFQSATYRTWLRAVRRTDPQRRTAQVPGSEELATAVARHLYKLMACLPSSPAPRHDRGRLGTRLSRAGSGRLMSSVCITSDRVDASADPGYADRGEGKPPGSAVSRSVWRRNVGRGGHDRHGTRPVRRPRRKDVQ